MNEVNWRFPGNSYASEQGLDTSDMETFKKDPIASLAREICQNSIDARKDFSKPVIVEFNSFEIKTEDIPGKARLLEEVVSCQNYWSYHEKIHKQLGEMNKTLSKEVTKCLRISDFNTTGLKGVRDDQRSGWYLLTKGSGVSDKVGSSGGSKGIGKFATFVASEFNTVFYSTLNEDGEIAYQGITKLCSTIIAGSREKTIGIGYYTDSLENTPIIADFSLDDSFKREETGTDIYILGFRQEDSWVKDIVTKILDSFMVALVRNTLIIKINDVTISSETLEKVVFSDEYVSHAQRDSIIAQYKLLTDDSVYVECKEIDGYGSIEVRVLRYNRENAPNAPKDCVIVRYPFMKITSIKRVSSIPCAALCIIDDNKLNRILRDIENPQHTNWEPNRISQTEKRNEIKSLIKELRSSITNIVTDYVTSGESTVSDIEGAEEYLPDSDLGEGYQGAKILQDRPRATAARRAKPPAVIGAQTSDDGEDLEPDIGSFIEGEGGEKPSGENEGGGGSTHVTGEEGEPIEGDSEILVREKLTCIVYRFFVTDKKNGQYVVSFVAPVDEQDCYLTINLVDGNGRKNPVTILKAELDGIHLAVDKNKQVKFSMYQKKNYRFTLTTNQTNLFSSEVNIYARR